MLVGILNYLILVAIIVWGHFASPLLCTAIHLDSLPEASFDPPIFRW